MKIELTDEVLRDAAIHVRQAMLDSLPADNEYRHEFSPKFEAKMEKLLKQAKRRYHIGRITQQAAAIALAALVGISTWLAVDTEARAAALRWVREIYENSVIFHFFGDEDANADLSYEPTWLPDGCIRETENSNAVGKTIVYHDINDELLLFRCYRIHDGFQGQSIFDSEFEIKTAEVNGMNAEFYIPSDPAESSELSWIDEEIGVVFSVIGYLSENDLLRIAESVYPIK